jgi:hypothetical protein
MMATITNWNIQASATECVNKLLYLLNSKGKYDKVKDIVSDVIIFANLKYGLRRYLPSVLGFSSLFLGL